MTKDCSTCWYKSFSRTDFPCSMCENYNKYVTDEDIFWLDKEDPKKMDKYEPTDKLAQGLNGITVKELQDTEWPFPLKEDMVESPKHYMLFPGIEVRDLMKRLVEKIARKSDMDYMQVSDYVQAMQYFCRFMEKGGKEDLEKGVWYMNKVIEAYEPSSAA